MSNYENFKHLNYVLKLKRVIYKLKQALRDQYERLSRSQLKIDSQRGKVDTTIFRKHKEKTPFSSTNIYR